MITDRELDAQLVAAALVHDADLPALPEDFLAFLRSETGAEHPGTHSASGSEPASVIAARQLVSDAKDARTAPRPRRRRPNRKAILRVGAAVLVAAAAWTTAVVVTTPDQDRTPTAAPVPSPTAGPALPTEGPIDPPGGLTLLAAEAITFPYSLDPEPASLTAMLSLYGGITPFGTEPAAWTASYRSNDDPGFTFSISTQDPREGETGSRPQDYHANDDILESGTVGINGAEADFIRGDYASPSCRKVPGTLGQTEPPAEVCSASFAELFWQRADGQWVYLWGEGDTYSEITELASVAQTIVDRPQPVPLQVGLAPAAWSVSGYEDNSTLTLISDAEPSISNRISVSMYGRWQEDYTVPGFLEDMTQGNPVEQVTVQGQPAELVSVPDPFTGPGFAGREEKRRMWNVAAQFPDGPVFLLQAPDTLSREDVLAIAEQLTYTP
ncbi:MAG: hypothetical protein ACR2JG_12990 [Geodermatophilaceae bacterium]